MQIARRGAGALAAGGEPGGNGDNQRNGRDQAHPLMNFQHVRALIEQRLMLGISLGLVTTTDPISRLPKLGHNCTVPWCSRRNERGMCHELKLS